MIEKTADNLDKHAERDHYICFALHSTFCDRHNSMQNEDGVSVVSLLVDSPGFDRTRSHKQPIDTESRDRGVDAEALITHL